MKIGVIANPFKDGAQSALLYLLDVIKGQKLESIVEDESLAALELANEGFAELPATELAKECDVVIVLGRM